MTAEVATSSFRGNPPPVEVLHAGVWLAGELLGWRHDEAGSCRVRVRCVVGGLRHTAWTDLTHLRLPAPAPDDAASTGPATPCPADHDAPTDRFPPASDIPRPRRAGLVEWIGG
ncbi:hypothetical protein [Geodermatophilus ruber]|uniref:Uncharacterized protein n=1 Tax=Geodermatophilus ruber TaxID=504800 RepID=A0A1I4JNP9_9ACTN|nr:hypothetical protein [Geodermatophilus ruber]SFL68160.1 hypothetical protein SAMN04488085_11576 [Geodermatophilus ruber]